MPRSATANDLTNLLNEDEFESANNSIQFSIDIEEKSTRGNIDFKSKLPEMSLQQIYILLYNFIMPFFVIATASSFAYFFSLDFVFPSLGPTAFLHFAIPSNPAASPRNTLMGHVIGILSGALSLKVTDLYDHDNAFMEGVGIQRIFCVSLSVGLTCFLMMCFKASHPPAGATTLIISLGILKTPLELLIIIASVSLITLEALILNRLFRKDERYPIWSAKTDCSYRNSDSLHAIRLISTKLEKKELTIDNFLDFFKLYQSIKDDENMKIIIQFAKENHNELKKLKSYGNIVPYSTHISISQ
eukprot:196912_1